MHEQRIALWTSPEPSTRTEPGVVNLSAKMNLAILCPMASAADLAGHRPGHPCLSWPSPVVASWVQRPARPSGRADLDRGRSFTATEVPSGRPLGRRTRPSFNGASKELEMDVDYWNRNDIFLDGCVAVSE